MSRMLDALNAVCAAAKAAIDASDVVGSTFTIEPKGTIGTVAPGQCYPGWPLVPELVNELGQSPGQWQLTAYPSGRAKPTTRYSPYDNPLFTPASIPLSRSIAGAVITFGGSIGTAPLYVHTVVNGDGDAFVATTPSQSLPSLATAVAAAVNALGLDEVSAVASGNAVTLSGVHLFACNIVGSGTVSYEIARYERTIQLSVWASDPVTRLLIGGALETLGGTLNPYLTLPDGSLMYVTAAGDDVDDDSQSSGSLYIAHTFLSVEYGIMAVVPTSQLGAVENLVTPPKGALVTEYVG